MAIRYIVKIGQLVELRIGTPSFSSVGTHTVDKDHFVKVCNLKDLKVLHLPMPDVKQLTVNKSLPDGGRDTEFIASNFTGLVELSISYPWVIQ